MTQWGEGAEFQRIGDIMVRNAPFLKMYTEYVKNFDTAMTAIGALYSKNRQFQAIMDEIHVSGAPCIIYQRGMVPPPIDATYHVSRLSDTISLSQPPNAGSPGDAGVQEPHAAAPHALPNPGEATDSSKRN